MEYLIEYALFLAKAATVVVVILLLAGGVAAAVSSSREAKPSKKGRIRVTKMNGHFDEMRDVLRHAVLNRHELKQIAKQEKQAAKQEAKAAKKTAAAAVVTKAASQQAGQDTEQSKPPRKRRIFVLDFKGDLAASQVRSLREEVTAVLSLLAAMKDQAQDKAETETEDTTRTATRNATRKEAETAVGTTAGGKTENEAVVRLESPGGMVHGYGLAASQLLRLKNGGVSLTVCVDKVAASGGYLMACIADRLLAAPFAVIGSIGVLVQMPNFHRVLKKNEVDFETVSAGEYKRTLSLFGEVTNKGREKAQQDVDEVHEMFKGWVKGQRPAMDIDKIATGETWLGLQAKQKGLVDDIRTSDEYLLKVCEDADVFEVEYEIRKSIQEKLVHSVHACAEHLLGLFVERSRPDNYWS